MRCKTSCGKTRPHTTTLASICAYCATNHCQCPAYGNMEHDQHNVGEGRGEGPSKNNHPHLHPLPPREGEEKEICRAFKTRMALLRTSLRPIRDRPRHGIFIIGVKRR